MRRSPRAASLAFCIAVLSACAPVVPLQAWTFDPTRLEMRTAPDPASVAPLAERIVQLHQRRDEVRGRIAVEPDAARRLALYADLHQVGAQLSPLERQFALEVPAR